MALTATGTPGPRHPPSAIRHPQSAIRHPPCIRQDLVSPCFSLPPSRSLEPVWWQNSKKGGERKFNQASSQVHPGEVIWPASGAPVLAPLSAQRGPGREPHGYPRAPGLTEMPPSRPGVTLGQGESATSPPRRRQGCPWATPWVRHWLL